VGYGSYPTKPSIAVFEGYLRSPYPPLSGSYPPLPHNPPRALKGPWEAHRTGGQRSEEPYPGAFHTPQVAQCEPRVRPPTKHCSTMPPGWPHPCTRERQCSPENGLNRGHRSYSTGFRAVPPPRESTPSTISLGSIPVEQGTTHIPFTNCRAHRPRSPVNHLHLPPHGAGHRCRRASNQPGVGTVDHTIHAQRPVSPVGDHLLLHGIPPPDRSRVSRVRTWGGGYAAASQSAAYVMFTRHDGGHVGCG
jgi:hypothetical protein